MSILSAKSLQEQEKDRDEKNVRAIAWAKRSIGRSAIVSCHWCKEIKGQDTPSVEVRQSPVNGEPDESGIALPNYMKVGLCKNHLFDLENGCGIYDSEIGK